MAYQPIVNPAVPYVGEVEGGLISGKMVRVQGQVPADSTFFAINYQLGPSLNPRDDVALHISPRFKEGIIIRNHIQSMTWGPEESDGSMCLQCGTPFEIVIFCEYQCYKIAVNGRHFAEFTHRLPYNKVTHLVIDGQVEITSIFYETVSIPKPSAPIPDDPIDIGPPAPGGLYPTLNTPDKQKSPMNTNDSKHKQYDHIYQARSPKSDEKVFSGLDKVSLAVGGLVVAGSVAAAVHAYKKNKKKNESEGDYQKVKPPKSPNGLGGLGTLGAVLATSLASNAFQRDTKAHGQDYSSSDAKSDIIGSFLGALGGAAGGLQSNYKPQSQTNLLGEALSGVLGGGGRHQQPHHPPSSTYYGYPQAQNSQGDNGNHLSSGLGGVLLKSALDGLSSHVSQKIEKKLTKELSKSLNNTLNLTPRKA
ncbi:uncharacterized protein LOC131671326 [Phymastichus coffea]|uniref:uncharacterized protein LOC131671326 n=1 Tax=Phymastichus coffea TaxID=108790 RepID=UPI00273B1FD2|nr:uncharacterized protein LOC131671326 [Phymastichus coffea]